MTSFGRRSLVLVRPVHLTARPDWDVGSLPLRVDALTASTEARTGYFSSPCARILYGTATRPTRWHRFLPDGAGRHDDTRNQDTGTAVGFAAELLLPDPIGEPSAAFAVLHVDPRGDDQLELLRRAADRRNADAKLPDIATTVQPFATADPTSRTFTIAFRSSTGQITPPAGISETLGWSPEQAWLWQLASRGTPQDYPPDPDHADRLLAGAVVLSADWRGLISREGAAFVALRTDQGPDDPFLGYAQLYAHTTYLDALLLGMIQGRQVEQMVTESAMAFDAPDMPRHLEHLDERAARFRTIYWLRDASNHGTANDILDAYQAQHRLPERFTTVLAEIADLGRLVQSQDSQRIAAALGVLTIVGLPIGTSLEVLQALQASSPRDLAIGLAAAFAATGAMLTTRPGRLLIRQLRRLR